MGQRFPGKIAEALRGGLRAERGANFTIRNNATNKDRDGKLGSIPMGAEKRREAGSVFLGWGGPRWQGGDGPPAAGRRGSAVGASAPPPAAALRGIFWGVGAAEGTPPPPASLQVCLRGRGGEVWKPRAQCERQRETGSGGGKRGGVGGNGEKKGGRRGAGAGLRGRPEVPEAGPPAHRAARRVGAAPPSPQPRHPMNYCSPVSVAGPGPGSAPGGGGLEAPRPSSSSGPARRGRGGGAGEEEGAAHGHGKPRPLWFGRGVGGRLLPPPPR